MNNNLTSNSFSESDGIITTKRSAKLKYFYSLKSCACFFTTQYTNTTNINITTTVKLSKLDISSSGCNVLSNVMMMMIMRRRMVVVVISNVTSNLAIKRQYVYFAFKRYP